MVGPRVDGESSVPVHKHPEIEGQLGASSVPAFSPRPGQSTGPNQLPEQSRQTSASSLLFGATNPRATPQEIAQAIASKIQSVVANPTTASLATIQNQITQLSSQLSSSHLTQTQAKELQGMLNEWIAELKPISSNQSSGLSGEIRQLADKVVMQLQNLTETVPKFISPDEGETGKPVAESGGTETD